MSLPENDPVHDPQLREIVARLESERPTASLEFRARVLEELLSSRPAESRPSARAWALVTAYAGSGLLLIVVAALGLVGTGPFAA